jgi:hypothetical protein
MGHVPWDENEGHKLAPSENSSKIERGLLGQSIPSRNPFLDALTKAVWKISLIVGGLTIPQLVDTLSKRLDCSFDARYIKRLRDKVIGQSQNEVDRARIDERISFTRENYRMMREQLLKIVLDTRQPRARYAKATRERPRRSRKEHRDARLRRPQR